MQRIEFSDLTNRLHRNTMAAAALIIAIAFFNLKIGKATAEGLELQNLTTGVLIWSAFAVLLYHAVAFCLRSIEEYEHWELTLPDSEAGVWDGGVITVDLARRLKDAAETLTKITKNSGAIGHQGQTIFSENDAKQLKEVSEAAVVYAKRFANFPKITRTRFWIWDIGVTLAVVVVALLFAATALSSGHQLFCNS